MKLWGLLVMGAVLPFLSASSLPNHVALPLLLLPLFLALLVPSTRVYCLVPVFFLVTTLAINERLADRLPLSKNRTTVSVTGKVASLPQANVDFTSFIFITDESGSGLPKTIRVNWYAKRNVPADSRRPVPVIHAGDRWRLQLELRPTRSRVNFHGADNERWYFTDGIGALASVQEGDNQRLSGPRWYELQHRREALLERLEHAAGNTPAFRVLAALAIADRRGLQPGDRHILSSTGTGHLLAISGLHIGLAAGMGFYLGRALLLLIGGGFRQAFSVVIPWVTAWLAALAYSALSGFGVSTQRALIMLSVLTLVTLSRRQVHPLLGWLMAMALVLVMDPFAPLRAGFWLSFLAVAVLMMLFVPRHGRMAWWQKILLAQLGISLIMAPVGMYWFQQASLPGLLANLVAIPVVSILIVPLVLMSLVLVYFPVPVAGWMLTVASYLSDWLLAYLEFLVVLQPGLLSSTSKPAFIAMVLAMLGAALLLLPRGVPGRMAGVLLVLPLAFSTVHSMGDEHPRVDMLDVGQGLSVLVKDHDYLMLYDTGPGNGLDGQRAWDMVISSIHPMVKAGGQTLDLVVVSHADLDHAGGVRTLRSLYPETRFIASLPEQRPGISKCLAGMIWRTDNLHFSVLHPSAGLPYLGNDSSCVISVRGSKLNLLLSGDISKTVEQRLVDGGLEPHELFTVPHHGSSTSSSHEVIAAVQPAWAVISSGMGNRFKFPRDDVLKRYSEAGVPTLNTSQCGGIRFTATQNGGFVIQSARVVRDRLWRWPGAENCP